MLYVVRRCNAARVCVVQRSASISSSVTRSIPHRVRSIVHAPAEPSRLSAVARNVAAGAGVDARHQRLHHPPRNRQDPRPAADPREAWHQRRPASADDAFHAPTAAGAIGRRGGGAAQCVHETLPLVPGAGVITAHTAAPLPRRRPQSTRSVPASRRLVPPTSRPAA